MCPVQVADFGLARVTTRHEGLAESDDGEENYLADEQAKFPARFSPYSILSFMCSNR